MRFCGPFYICLAASSSYSKCLTFVSDFFENLKHSLQVSNKVGDKYFRGIYRTQFIITYFFEFQNSLLDDSVSVAATLGYQDCLPPIRNDGIETTQYEHITCLSNRISSLGHVFRNLVKDYERLISERDNCFVMLGKKRGSMGLDKALKDVFDETSMLLGNLYTGINIIK